MPSCSIYESPKNIQIREINDQLLTKFYPAMKNVATNLHNLSRAQEGISKFFNNYVSSLLELAHTGDKLHYFNSRYYAENLRKTAQILQKIYTELAKWIEHFSKLSVIIQENSDNDKDRLKSLNNSFIKKEKNLLKTLNKTQHTRFNMEEFYQEELKTAFEQQSQRYRFFAESNNDLIKQFLEWTKKIIKTIENEYNFLNQNEEEKRSFNQNTINNHQIRNKEVYSDPINKFNHLHTELLNSKNEIVSEDFTNVNNHSLNKTNQFNNIEEKNNVQQLTVSNKNFKTEENSQLDNKLFYKNDETDLPLMTLKNNSQSYKTNSNYLKNNNNNNSHESLIKENQTPETETQIENNFSNKILDNSNDFDSVKTNNNEKILENTNNYNIQHQIEKNDKIPIIIINNDDKLNKKEIIKTKPIFSVLDNGKKLKCITSFEAYSENQLTLNVDECITLIKSGTRGWVLVKTLDGLKQGWFPANFLCLEDS